MSLTKDQVRHVAKLANLPLDEKEEDLYAKQLSEVLDYIEQINSVDTNGIEPTFNVSGKTNVFRPDETVASLSQDEALQNAPKKEREFFVTKGVFSDE